MRGIRDKSSIKSAEASAISDRIWQLARRQGLRSYTAIAEKAQIHHSTVCRGFRNGDWSDTTLRKIADSWGIPWENIKRGTAPRGSAGASRTAESVETYIVGAGHQFAIAEDPPPDFTPWPSPRDLYACRIMGDSMEPLARDGQCAVALKGIWPESGDLAFIEMEDGTVILRRIHILDPGTKKERWLLQPINPAHDVEEVPRSTIRHALKIWGIKL